MQQKLVMEGPATKCGYCGDILRGGSCGTILNHHCFETYDEYVHVIKVDDNAVVTMRKRHESEDLLPHSKEGAAQSTSLSPCPLNQDELLIELVRVRKGLWDHSIPPSERTKLKKDGLWQEIMNIFDGSLSMETIKQKWKHLRDSYMKARKKMQGYVRSGSGAEAGHPVKSSFAHYEKMRFLDDTVKTASTVSSVQHLLEAASSSHQHVDDDMQVDKPADDHMLYISDDLSDSACPSSAEKSSSRTSRSSSIGAKNTKLQRQAEIENKFLRIIDEEAPKKRDIVDSYLDQLGDLLRRLSYIRRRNLQRRLMDIAIAEEDEQLLERENAQ
ncbi:uncharacterized protein [Mycetomoellerius zeteki]|nr:PREDICTED: uncharacterized protein LOC108720184 [Trachymyrmex zeteki]